MLLARTGSLCCQYFISIFIIDCTYLRAYKYFTVTGRKKLCTASTSCCPIQSLRKTLLRLCMGQREVLAVHDFSVISPLMSLLPASLVNHCCSLAKKSHCCPLAQESLMLTGTWSRFVLSIFVSSFTTNLYGFLWC